jgi:hypothetical protein
MCRASACCVRPRVWSAWIRVCRGSGSGLVAQQVPRAVVVDSLFEAVKGLCPTSRSPSFRQEIPLTPPPPAELRSLCTVLNQGVQSCLQSGLASCGQVSDSRQVLLLSGCCECTVQMCHATIMSVFYQRWVLWGFHYYGFTGIKLSSSCKSLVSVACSLWCIKRVGFCSGGFGVGGWRGSVLLRC